MAEDTVSSIRVIITNEFGDYTDITKNLLRGSHISEIYEAIREILTGCGYAGATVDEWLPSI